MMFAAILWRFVMKVNGVAKQDRRRFLEVAGAATATLAFNGLPLALRVASAATEKIKIGIVGSGKVGGTLGGVWVKAGHEVMFSSRHIEHDKALAAKLGSNARAGTPRQAAAFGEVVIISVPYHALPEVGKDLEDLIKGKVVIDTNNPFEWRDGEIATWARQKGAGLASAELLPGARIVRAFNAIGYVQMGTAHEEPGRIGMPIAGDDARAIETASRLIRDIGYEPVLIGGLAMGKHLMPGTPLAGERSAEEIRKIAATLN
jgi:predicted dinucleotide-binding enzyme